MLIIKAKWRIHINILLILKGGGGGGGGHPDFS